MRLHNTTKKTQDFLLLRFHNLLTEGEKNLNRTQWNWKKHIASPIGPRHILSQKQSCRHTGISPLLNNAAMTWNEQSVYA